MNNTLDDMVREYTHTAELLTQMLAHGNELLQKARQSGNRARVQALRARQQDIYMQRAHVLEVREHLKTYYDDSNCSAG